MGLNLLERLWNFFLRESKEGVNDYGVCGQNGRVLPWHVFLLAFLEELIPR